MRKKIYCLLNRRWNLLLLSCLKVRARARTYPWRWNLLLLTVFCFISGCGYKKEPKSPTSPSSKEVEESIASLSEKSFEFELSFAKPEVKGSFYGIHAGDRVKVKGCWDFNGEKETFEGIRIGGEEYRQEKGKWIAGEDTPETRPLNILNTICSFGNYEFKAIKGRNFIYAFKPNLLFMDPGLYKDTLHLLGKIWIGINSILPERIFAKSENVKWDFTIKNIDKKLVVPDPLAKAQTLRLSINSEVERTAQILKQRFELYGFTEVAYKLKDKGIDFKFQGRAAKPYLFQPGRLELYKAHCPSTLSEENIKFVRGDSTKPIRVDEKIDLTLTNIVYTSGIIELTFDKNPPEGARVAVVVDGEVIEVFPDVWGNKLRITGTRELYIKLKLPLNSVIGNQ